MKITKRFKDPLTRQANEAVRISNRNKSELLNSKNKYIQICVSRITAEEDLLARKKRLFEKEREEKIEKQSVKELKE